MEVFWNVTCYILSTLLGLAVGSFLNVCIYRLPIGKFWSKSRSYCPKCGTPIKAYDNIPLLSYIILKGKCRACHEPISPRYPIIEALNMVLWIVNFAVFGISYITIIYDILVSTLIVVAMIDYDTTEIPDSSVIAIVVMALLTFIPVFGMDWKSQLIGAFCISVPMLILSLFGLMGMGDAKLFFGLGLLFGWEKILIVFILSFVMGSVVGLINYVRINRRADDISPANVENADDTAPSEGAIDRVSEGEQNAVSECDTCVVADADATDNEAENTTKKRHSIALDMSASDEEFEAELDEKLAEGKALAFGPFICIASVIAMYFGDAIVTWYKGLLGF